MDVGLLRTAALATNPARTTMSEHDAMLNPKLVAAAHQFEASMMAELLKPLSSDDLFGGDGDGSEGAEGAVSGLTSSADGSGGALMSFGSEALAKAVSEKGGFGIAQRVLDQFAQANLVSKKEGLDGQNIRNESNVYY